MKGFDTLKIKSAVRSRSKMSFDFSHLTTMNIGEIVPLCTFDVVPGDKINLDTELFSRVAPLVKPTYGKIKFKTVSAFVPYHMIAADAEAWLAGKTTWEGYTPNHRSISYLQFVYFVSGGLISTNIGATSANQDFNYVDSMGNTTYFLFTKFGKYVVKILNSLGYSIPSGIDLQAGSSWRTNVANLKMSAYPLLCFFKLYNDYLSQSQRFNTSQLSNILNAIKYGKAYSGIWNEATGDILYGGLSALFSNLLLNYENDYFISAWQSPNAPLAAVENVNSINSPGSGVAIQDTITDTQAAIGSVLPERVLQYLKAFDNWVRRNNYSGSRSVQQLYSRFGIKTSDFKEHYSRILSVDEFPIMVGDVTATADSINVPLGDYAGKAIMAGKKTVSIEVDDFGELFVFGFITVQPMNSYGFDRRVLRVAPLDYYNPEFDGLGADAISVGEFFASPIDETRAVLDTAVYGFTERYNSYRFCRDVISGEFRNYRNNGDMNVWHTGRLLDSVRNAGHLVAQNTDVNTLPQTDSEYNRIFSNTSGDVDHFYITAKFHINAVRPMRSLNQVVDLGEGETIVPRNGNTIS